MSIHPSLDQRIEITPGVCGGKPRITGHRIRVQDIVAWYEFQGMTPDEIVSGYPQLTLADVHAALAYYYDHTDEMRKQAQEDKAWIEEFIRNNPDVDVLTVEDDDD